MHRAVVGVAGCVVAGCLLTGCPGSSTAEGTTDTDRQRAGVVRADPMTAGGGVVVGDRLHGRTGWRRTFGTRSVVVPVSDLRDDASRLRHAHQVVRTVVGQARLDGWQIFYVQCRVTRPRAAMTWSAHAYLRASGYVIDLQVSAKADVAGAADDGRITVQVLAPYHLDPPSLVGDPLPPPLPTGGTCLDSAAPPASAQTAGSDHPVAQTSER